MFLNVFFLRFISFLGLFNMFLFLIFFDKIVYFLIKISNIFIFLIKFNYLVFFLFRFYFILYKRLKKLKNREMEVMARKTGHFIFRGRGLKNTAMFVLHFDLEVECNICLHRILIVKSRLPNKLYFWHFKKSMCF